MNAEEITARFIDATTQTSWSITNTRHELRAEIDAAIAAAVQQEREACATLAEIREMRYREHDMFPAYGMNGLASEAHDIAAAIRARNGRK